VEDHHKKCIHGAATEVLGSLKARKTKERLMEKTRLLSDIQVTTEVEVEEKSDAIETLQLLIPEIPKEWGPWGPLKRRHTPLEFR